VYDWFFSQIEKEPIKENMKVEKNTIFRVLAEMGKTPNLATRTKNKSQIILKIEKLLVFLRYY